MIIDSLIIEIGLDPSKLSAGAKQAIEDLRKFEDEAGKRADGVETSTKKIGAGIGGVKTQVLELFGALGGTAAIIGFAASLTNADAALGRVSRSTGVSANEIAKWQGVARIFGGDAESMAQSFIRISDTFSGWKVGIVSPLVADFRAISTAGGVVIDLNKGVEQSFLDLSENLRNIAARDPALAGMLGRRAGLDPALLDALLKGPDAVKKMLELAGGLGAATKESVEQAGALAQAWNKVVLAIEGKGRTGLAGGERTSASEMIAAALEATAKDISTPSMLSGNTGGLTKLRETTWQEWWDTITLKKNSAPPPSTSAGAFKSQAEKEAFIRSESVKRGLDPDVMVKVAKSEGFDKFLGDNGTSGSAFQLHVTPGGRGNAVGDQFLKATGKSPLDQANEALAIQFALDDIRAHGLSAYHGAARVGLGPMAGGAGQGGSSLTTTKIDVNGPVNIYPPPGTDGAAMAGKFTQTLKNQSFAAQANDGQN